MLAKHDQKLCANEKGGENMTLLSERIGDNDSYLFGILKFSSKEHLESLRKGKLYLNNFQLYRDIEKKQKNKGQGDAHDVTLLLNNVDWELQGGHSNVLYKSNGNVKLEYKEDYLTHVFCATGITANWLEIIHEDENLVKVKLVFPKEFKQHVLENFGDHVLIIAKNKDFFDLISAANISFDARKVTYRDQERLYRDRLYNFLHQKSERFFEKDNFFSIQNEFRIVFPDLISTDPEIIEIGNIEKITQLMSVEDLFNKGELTYKFLKKQ